MIKGFCFKLCVCCTKEITRGLFLTCFVSLVWVIFYLVLFAYLVEGVLYYTADVWNYVYSPRFYLRGGNVTVVYVNHENTTEPSLTQNVPVGSLP